jgi:hypothetical protein
MTPDADFLANEAFIRRAAAIAGPFMLKGSFVTRQYFEEPALRRPNDLDWTYLGSLTGVEQARQVFNDWAIQVTELPMDDDITFRSFREDAFWRMIDYAMDDDFPTVNTNLQYQVGEAEPASLTLDISFNLPMAVPSVPLWYQPAQGAPFTISYTTPLALQVAWKLHQTLVRPRFKDLFDLLHLLKHPTFTPEVRQQALASLAEECQADHTDLNRLSWLLAGNLRPLYKEDAYTKDLATIWHYWRHGQTDSRHPGLLSINGYFDNKAGTITDPSILPATLTDFERQLREAFTQAGFDIPEIPKAGTREKPIETYQNDVSETITDPPQALIGISKPPTNTPQKTGLLAALRRLFS